MLNRSTATPVEQQGRQRRIPSPTNFAWILGAAICSIAICCTALQILIEPSTVNFACALAALSATGLTAFYLNSRNFDRYPLSVLMILGLALATGPGALIAQTFSWRPLTFNLNVPVKTFWLSTFYLIFIIAIHATLYKHSAVQALRSAITSSVYKPIGLMNSCPPGVLWVMGAIGLVSMAVAGSFSASRSIEFGDAGGKFLQGLIPLAVAPFMIPFLPFLTNVKKPTSIPAWLCLGGYFLCLLVISAARNSRGAFASALLAIGLLMLIVLISGRLRLNSRTSASLLAASLLAIPFMAAMSDVGTAMLVARGARESLSAEALSKRTWEIYGNKALLNQRRELDEIVSSGFNEKYISNIFFARIVVIKFIDLNIYHAEGSTESQLTWLRESAVKRLAAGLPTPVLSKLGIDVDKSDLMFSSGDAYRFVAARGLLGGYTSGSSLADGVILFGLFYFPLAAMLALAFFIVVDAMTDTHLRSLFISPAAVILLPNAFTSYLHSESVAGQVVTLYRSIPQSILIYAAILLAARLFSPLGGLTRTSSRAQIRPVN